MAVARPDPQLRGIREVARLAGVSPGTVSNAFNHPHKVSEATRNTIMSVVDRLGFVPDRRASDLRRGRSQTVGIVVPDITNPFFSEVARGAILAAEDLGYAAVVCDTNGDPAKEDQALRTLQEQNVAGIVITPVGRIPAKLEQVREKGTGVIIMDHPASNAQYCSVSVDDADAAVTGVGHLLTLGGQEVILLNGPRSVRQCSDRRRGALRALKSAGLPSTNLTEIVCSGMTVEAGYTAIRDQIPNLTSPALLFCTNDLLAIGAERALLEAGVAVPSAVAIVGCDDIDRVRDVAVPITSVRRPKAEIGHAAIELLIGEIENDGNHQHEKRVFQPRLVQRSSTQRLRVVPAE